MSQTIQITALLSMVGVTQLQSASGTPIAMTGSKFAEGIMAVPTTAGGTAIPVSALANLGLALFMNADPTNYVEILTAVSGTAFVKLLPGDVAVFRFDPAVSAPAMLAHTASANVEFLILEN